MSELKNILAISGSTRKASVNLHILKHLAGLYKERARITIYEELDQLPHFNPDLDIDPPPPQVARFRELIGAADGVLICTPEYVFSMPGSLKNALEWMVSTVILSDKPAALITASLSGLKAHEELQLVMKTIGATLSPATNLLIQSPKTKISADGQITDPTTAGQLHELMENILGLI
ncbi:MAG: NAD(P)H-dependent oxidoreductase [Chitinophagaceae bacterium]|nr:NAD(P)H-dependent oxidoreductase [Chitinophagaceae bacterium]